MNLSWVTALTPAQTIVLVIGIVVVLGGVAAILVLSKHLGLSITKNGLVFGTNEKTDMILSAVKDIKEADGRQEEAIKRLGEKVNNNAKDTLRLTFYNELLPPAERLVAGKRYLAAGGNGETQMAIDKYAGEYPDVWQGILAVGENT